MSVTTATTSSPVPGAVRRRPLSFLIVFVTRRCNAKCGTCFYADSLNDGSPELSLDDYQQIADKAGRFNNLLFSGGEPSLRADLAQIAEIFHKTCGVPSIAMPTNGLLTERIVSIAEGILERCPGARLDVNLSLDGMDETHNRIRGVPGNFKKSEATLRALIALREHNPRLRVHVETVICNQNYDEIPVLMEYIWQNFEVNGHYAEVIRGTPPDPGLAPPPDEKLRTLHEFMLMNHGRYNGRQRGPDPLELDVLHEIYSTQRRWLTQGGWPMTCTAGERVAVIEPTAEVRLCELKPIIGNLRDHDMDLHALLDAAEARALRKWIVDSKCSCTHCVFISESVQEAGATVTGAAAQAAPATLAGRMRAAVQSVFSRG